MRLIGVDPEALARAGAGGPLQVQVPGPEAGQLRALASPDLPLDDGEAQLRYAQSVVPLQVTDRVERIPGVTNGESFVAVDLAAMAAAVDRTLEVYDVLLVTGDADVDEIASIVRERAPDAVVTSRAGVVDAQLAQPVVERTVRVLRAVSGVAALVAVFAVVLVVALGAPTRRRTVDPAAGHRRRPAPGTPLGRAGAGAGGRRGLPGRRRLRRGADPGRRAWARPGGADRDARIASGPAGTGDDRDHRGRAAGAGGAGGSGRRPSYTAGRDRPRGTREGTDDDDSDHGPHPDPL